MYTDYDENNNQEVYYEKNSNNKDKIKKIVFFVLVFVVIIILIIIFAKGCSKNEGSSVATGNNDLEPTIIINRNSLTLAEGESQQLEVDVSFANTKNPVVTWYSEDSNIAVVDDQGYITGISEGTTKIIATYKENDEEYTTECEVLVTSVILEIQSIDIIQDDINLIKGESLLLQINVTPSDAKLNDNDLVFSSDDTSIATVSSEGYVNAIDTGTTTINVKTKDGSFGDKVTVTVTKKGTTVINPVKIEIIGISNGIAVGNRAEIYYIVTPDNATDKKVTWTSSNPSVATVKDGFVTGVGVGTCTIVASTSNNISDKIEITVQPNDVAVKGVTITNGETLNIMAGGTKQLNYEISPSNATNKKVTFLSSDTSIAHVDSDGLIIGLKAGVATITVRTSDGNKRDTITVTVIGDESSDESGGNSGTGESGGTSGSGSGSGSTGSESGSNSSTCKSSEIVTITHNYKSKGPIISAISFDNAKAFTAQPKVTVTAIGSCIKNQTLSYEIYKGTTKDNVTNMIASGNNLKVGSTIISIPGTTSGYYKIKMTGTTTNGEKITKTYYLIVQLSSSGTGSTITDTSAPVLSFTIESTSSSNVDVKITALDTLSGVKQIAYCTTSQNTSCNPFIIPQQFSTSTTKASINVPVAISGLLSEGQKRLICANATDYSGNTSTTKCKQVASN